MRPSNTGRDRAQTPRNNPLYQVTPLSKYLALALFVGLPFLGGWIGYSHAPVKIVEVVRAVPTTPNSVPEMEPEVMRPGSWYESERDRLALSTTTVTFTGSLQVNEMTAWDTTVECRQLYLRDYPQNELHDYYVQKALAGNTVQRFADHGLLLNLPWEEIPAVDQEHIQQGTAQDPVSVRLQKKPEVGRGVGPCYSFFEYRGIEE